MRAKPSSLQASPFRQPDCPAPTKPGAFPILKTIPFAFAATVATLLATSANGAGVPHGVVDYEDTFTVRTTARPDGLYNNNSGGGYNVETTHGNPAATWTPFSSFSFNSGGGSTCCGYPGNGSNIGAAGGLAQSGGGDFSFAYGLRQSYVVSVDAILPNDRLDITSLPDAGGGIFGANRLSVFFRLDTVTGFPGIGLFNGGAEADTGVRTGVGDNNWHNYAVHFDQLHNRLSVFVDGILKTTLDLTTFGGGAYANYSNGAIGMGGSGNPGQPGNTVFWMDNFKVGTLSEGAAVPVGSSTLIDQLHYSDTFTTTGNGGAAGRPGGGAFPVGLPGINVENNYGNPAQAWTDFKWSICTDDNGILPNGAPYVGTGAGSATGMTQSGGAGVDFGLEYGLANQFVVQFDAFQPPERIDITASTVRDTIGGGLAVFIRPPGLGLPEIGLYNGTSETDTGLKSGIPSANAWHNYAVRFDNVNKFIEVFVDQTSRGVVNLATLNGGSHNTIQNTAVSVGGAATFERFWSDNFQLGAPVPAALGDSVVLSTDVMLNQGPATSFTDGSRNDTGLEIIRNWNTAQPGYLSTAVPYTASVEGPTLDLSAYGAILNFQAGNLGADIYQRTGNPLYAPGDGEAPGNNNGGIGFGGHSPWLITFDLNAIRASRLDNTGEHLALTGRFGMQGGADPGGQVQGVVFVDGQPVFTSGLKSIATPSDPISLSLSPSSRWLTLVITSGAGNPQGTFWNDGAFRDMKLTVSANQAPSVSIISPHTGDLFTVPADITLTADASDSDGILSVEFFSGITSLGTLYTPPYTLPLNYTEPGVITYTALATDTLGASTLSEAVTITNIADTPPSVFVSSPTEGATFAVPAAFDFTAEADDAQGPVSLVEFYVGPYRVGTADAAPFTMPVTIPYAGTYVLTAAATDSAGLRVVSAPVTITVTSTGPSLPVTDGLQLLLVADTGFITNASGGVTAWADQTANHNDAAQAAGGLAPLFVPNAVNGRPVVRFDGTDDYLHIANSPSMQPGTGDWTVLVVAKRLADSRGDYPQIIGSRPWTNSFERGWAVAYSSTGVLASHYGDDTTGHDVLDAQAGSSLSTNHFDLWQVEENRTGGTTAFYVNGGLNNLLSLAMPAGTIEQTNDVYIGREIGGSNNRRANMDLAEVLVYNRVLSPAERAAVSSYLRAKYALALPPTVAVSSPTDGASLPAPASFNFTAEADDADGSVSRVDFYVGQTHVATATQPPFTVPLSIPNPGTLTLTAAATDNLGLRTLSAPVTITIAGEAPSLPNDNELRLWLAADGIVATDLNGFVTDWADQSLNYNDAAQHTEGLGPLFVPNALNGKPVLRFDGADDYMELVNAASLQPGTGDWTVFFVGQRRGGSLGDWPQIIGARPWTAGLDKGWAVVFGTSGIVSSHFADGSTGHDVNEPGVPAASAFSTTRYQIWQVEENRAAGTTAYYVGGRLDRSGPTAMPAGAIDQTEPIDIGRDINGGNSRRASMDLAEVLIYGRALDAVEREAVTFYLSTKYGMPQITSQNAPPSVEITSPADGDSFITPNSITLTASANDIGGSIASVEFFNGGTSLGIVTSSPYTLDVINGAPGIVTYTALATDNLGAFTVSVPITVTNLPTALPPGSLDLTATPGSATISIPSVPGFSYRVLYTASLAPDEVDWREVSPGAQVGTGALLQWVDSGTLGQRFYRLEVISL